MRAPGCSCPTTAPTTASLQAHLLTEWGPEVRRLRITWRMKDPSTAVITAPGVPEDQARELLRTAKWHLVVGPYRCRTPEGPPELQVRHALCRSCVRAIEERRPGRAAA